MKQFYRTVASATVAVSIFAIAALAGGSQAADDPQSLMNQNTDALIAASAAPISADESDALVDNADVQLADVATVAVAPIEEQPVPVIAASLGDLVERHDPSVAMTADMTCLAGAIYFETRGEPLLGQLAVAKVVLNRKESSRWPNSVCGVITQPYQFSFVRGGQIPRANRSSQAWRRAVAIAHIARDDLWETPADDAYFFHARYVSPRWRLTRVAQIENHIFYR